MEGFTIVDAGVAVIVVMSAILAYSRGFVREVFAIAGWIFAAIAAFAFAKQAEPLIRQIPVLSDYLGESCELSIIVAFAAVFAGALILASIITPIFGALVQRSALSGIDQGLGFLFGVARGVLLVAVAFLAYNRIVAEQAVPAVDGSRSAQIFATLQERLGAQVPSDAPGWIAARYNQLVGDCGAATTTPITTPLPDASAPTLPQQNVPDTTGTGTTETGTGAKTVRP